MSEELPYLGDASRKVSELDQVKRLEADDLFVLERLTPEHEKVAFALESSAAEVLSVIAVDVLDTELEIPLIAEFSGKMTGYFHASHKMTYGDLSSALLDCISAVLSLNTMSQRETWEHAKISHTHGYSKVEVHTNYQLSDATDDPTAELSTLSTWLGTMTIWEKKDLSSETMPVEYPVFTPKIDFELYAIPDIGEMRFICQTSEFTENSSLAASSTKLEPFIDSSLLESNSMSCYWAFCNGQTIACKPSEFREACQFFTGDADATSFTLPSYNNFIRPNPRVKYDDACQFVQHYNSLSVHQHDILSPDLNESIYANAKVTIPTRSTGGDTGVHSGKGTPSKQWYLGNLTCTFAAEVNAFKSLPGNTSTTGADVDIETRPRSVQIPLVVFLGAK